MFFFGPKTPKLSSTAISSADHFKTYFPWTAGGCGGQPDSGLQRLSVYEVFMKWLSALLVKIQQKHGSGWSKLMLTCGCHKCLQQLIQIKDWFVLILIKLNCMSAPNFSCLETIVQEFDIFRKNKWFCFLHFSYNFNNLIDIYLVFKKLHDIKLSKFIFR